MVPNTATGITAPNKLPVWFFARSTPAGAGPKSPVAVMLGIFAVLRVGGNHERMTQPCDLKMYILAIRVDHSICIFQLFNDEDSFVWQILFLIYPRCSDWWWSADMKLNSVPKKAQCRCAPYRGSRCYSSQKVHSRAWAGQWLASVVVTLHNFVTVLRMPFDPSAGDMPGPHNPSVWHARDVPLPSMVPYF